MPIARPTELSCRGWCRRFVPMLIVLAVFATACTADRFGLARSLHNLPVEGAVRVELHNFNELVVTTTGEGSTTSAGELHDIELGLAGPSEIEVTELLTSRFEIHNMRPSGRDLGNQAYVTVDVGDRLALFRGERVDENGVLPSIPTPFVNARPGSTISIRIDARELDCALDNICSRGNDGAVTFSVPLPTLPDPLPDACGPTNTFPLRVSGAGALSVDGIGTLARSATGGPLLDPHPLEADAFFCVIPI